MEHILNLDVLKSDFICQINNNQNSKHFLLGMWLFGDMCDDISIC